MNLKALTSLVIIAAATTAMALLGSCHSLDKWDNDYYGNFDALWTELDRHYCFFEQKDVDWDEVGARYRARINPEMDYTEFFALCAEMLNELRDGHTNLSSWFDVSYYRKWWSDYPENFDLRLIQEHYLNFDYNSGGPMIYKILDDHNIGYMRCSTFSGGYGMAFLDHMLLSMKDCEGLVIDVRSNSGGDLTTVKTLVSQFIDNRILGGYIQHKTGPGHTDFSEPYAYYIDPAENHVRWLKPVVVLTNRSTYSAANNFVSIMKSLPHVAVVGDVTGGGCGMPYSSELPCGWAVRFSACPIYDAEMSLTENGVAPSPGCRMDMNRMAALNGHDTILDTALRLIHQAADETRQSGGERVLAPSQI